MVERWRSGEERCNQTVRGNRSALRHRVLDLMTVYRRMQKRAHNFCLRMVSLINRMNRGDSWHAWFHHQPRSPRELNVGVSTEATKVLKSQQWNALELAANWKKWTYIQERNQWFIRGMQVCTMYVWRVANSLGLENVSLVNGLSYQLKQKKHRNQSHSSTYSYCL